MFSKDFRAFLEEYYAPSTVQCLSLKEVREHYNRYIKDKQGSEIVYATFKKIIQEKYKIEDGVILDIKRIDPTCPNCKDPSLPTHKVCSCSYTCGECEPGKRYMVRIADVCFRHADLYPKQETITVPTLDEALERGAKIARLKLELMDTEHIRHYLIKQSLEYFDRSEKIIDQLRALKADPSQ